MANEDQKLLLWVRSLPCRAFVHGACDGPVEAHHAGRHPLGKRAHDDTAIPLCRAHHRAWHDLQQPFRHWTREERALWAEVQIAYVRALRKDPNHREEVVW